MLGADSHLTNGNSLDTRRRQPITRDLYRCALMSCYASRANFVLPVPCSPRRANEVPLFLSGCCTSANHPTTQLDSAASPRQTLSPMWARNFEQSPGIGLTLNPRQRVRLSKFLRTSTGAWRGVAEFTDWEQVAKRPQRSKGIKRNASFPWKCSHSQPIGHGAYARWLI